MSGGFGLAQTKGQFKLSTTMEMMFLGTETLDPRVTFTRADATSCATRFSSSGLLVTVAANVPRFDYDPAVPAGTVGGELLANGNFVSGGAGWIKQDGNGLVSFSTGFANITTPDSVFAQCQPTPNPLVIGKTYLISITITATSGGGISVVAGSAAQSPTMNAVGTYSHYLTADAVQFQVKRAGGATNTTFTNISIREVTFAPRGLLIEESRANIQRNSGDPTNATGWSFSNLSRNRNQVGLDGAPNTATLITTVLGVVNVLRAEDCNNVAVSTTYARSIYVKAGTTSVVVMESGDNSVLASTIFNVTTNAITGVTTNASITDLGNGIKRCTRVYTTGATGTQNLGNYYFDAYGNATGAFTMTVYAVQMEVGAFATSYIPTTTAAATRASDAPSIVGASFTSWFDATQGTVVLEYDTVVGVNPNRGYLFDVTDAGNNRLSLRSDSAAVGTPAFVVGTGVSAITLSDGVLVPANTPTKVAGSYGATGLSFVRGTGVIQTNATASLVTPLANMGVGCNQLGSNQLNGHIRALQYYNTRLPDAKLQQLTT